MMSQEIWKDIPGYEENYQASNLGRIRSKLYNLINKNGVKRLNTPRIMKQRPHTKGYLCINLTKNRKSNTFLTHRIIAFCFIYNVQNKPFINHKNCIKTDNKISNLEWVTHKENMKHYVEKLKNDKQTQAYC